VLQVLAVLTVTVLSAVAIRDRLDPGEVGLILIYVMQLAGLLQWIVRQTAEVENQMTSVERILEYAKLTPEQSPALPPPGVHPMTWPSHGKLELENVGLQYAEDDEFILSGITCSIEPGEKIGVVGRTGAGKSSLIAALLRMATVSGKVKLDGVDLKSVPLKMLR
jgi:ATP-binding cassette subfamily C (CFTR/MRP) protein 4